MFHTRYAETTGNDHFSTNLAFTLCKTHHLVSMHIAMNVDHQDRGI